MPSTERRLTVLNQHRETGKVPVIRLMGRWLAQAGFAGGCQVVVEGKSGSGRLVVRVVAPPDPDWHRRRRALAEQEEEAMGGWFSRRRR
jgi:hypothetical protein